MHGLSEPLLPRSVKHAFLELHPTIPQLENILNESYPVDTCVLGTAGCATCIRIEN